MEDERVKRRSTKKSVAIAMEYGKKQIMDSGYIYE